jgi:hypothetical protein
LEQTENDHRSATPDRFRGSESQSDREQGCRLRQCWQVQGHCIQGCISSQNKQQAMQLAMKSVRLWGTWASPLATGTPWAAWQLVRTGPPNWSSLLHTKLVDTRWCHTIPSGLLGTLRCRGALVRSSNKCSSLRFRHSRRSLGRKSMQRDQGQWHQLFGKPRWIVRGSNPRCLHLSLRACRHSQPGRQGCKCTYPGTDGWRSYHSLHSLSTRCILGGPRENTA